MGIKILVFIFIACSYYELAKSQNVADVAAYRAKQQECIKELNIAAAEATQITGDKDVVNPSEAYKCYHNCLYKKMGLLTADGKPNNEAVVKFAQARFTKATQDNIKKELGSCAGSIAKGATSCDFVYNFETCMVKALKA